MSTGVTCHLKRDMLGPPLLQLGQDQYWSLSHLLLSLILCLQSRQYIFSRVYTTNSPFTTNVTLASYSSPVLLVTRQIKVKVPTLDGIWSSESWLTLSAESNGRVNPKNLNCHSILVTEMSVAEQINRFGRPLIIGSSFPVIKTPVPELVKIIE